MAANVENMMYVGETPWHGLGKRIPIEVPSDMAIVYAGLDWTVSKQPVFLGDGQEAKNYRAIVRDSDKRILSVQSDSYEPFQNREMFDFAEALVGTEKALFHTAGSLDGGRRVWAMMKAKDIIVLPKGDEVEQYLLLATSHDGSLAFLSAFTPVRVVCQNTLSLAIATAKSKVSVRHTGNLKDRVKQAQQIMGLASNYFEGITEVATALVRAPYRDPQMKELVETLFPVKPEDAKAGRVPTRTQNNRDEVTRLFTEGKGHDRIAGTAWAAINAVTEYTDHTASTRTTDRMSGDENRFNSIHFGTAAALRQKAFAKIGQQTGLQLAA
jgi:phage/plasmid-like protein (TIGR03299 family)